MSRMKCLGLWFIMQFFCAYCLFAGDDGAINSPDRRAGIQRSQPGEEILMEKMLKSEEELKKVLTPEQYHVCRLGGTERPFSGQYVNETKEGVYRCVVCGNDLFSSVAKFDSKTGWPSFWKAESEKNIRLQVDDSLGMRRTEVLCGKCGSHLGHVFDDGPLPTGKRYCINSISLKLHKTA